MRVIFSLSILLIICALLPVGSMAARDIAIPEDHGIRIIFNDAEFYFNGSNGGEITEYYDLSIDPTRSRNLANISIHGWLQGNLWPLFTSAIYNPYVQSDYSTGGDPDATVNLVEETSDRIITYTSSRMMNRAGIAVNDIDGSPVYINTTWVFNKRNGLIVVERTFDTQSSFNLPAGWRWYPFYFTRNSGFTYNGTFYFFNMTHTETVISNVDDYENIYDRFPVFPADDGIFGFAMPFSNLSIEGDGTHNAVIVYSYDGLEASEWRSDTSNGIFDITWAGAVHEFSSPVDIKTHTYRAILHFTHRSINENNVVKYARYADSLFPLIELNLTTDREVYNHGDPYTISASGIAHHDMDNITSIFRAINDTGVYLEEEYEPHDYKKGETFTTILFDGYIVDSELPGNRTFTLQLVPETGAIITSDSTMISIEPPE